LLGILINRVSTTSREAISTSNKLAQELLDVLEVARFCDCVVVTSVRQFLPYLRGLADFEQSCHVGGSANEG
jgi:hypothetical protein